MRLCGAPQSGQCQGPRRPRVGLGFRSQLQGDGLVQVIECVLVPAEVGPYLAAASQGQGYVSNNIAISLRCVGKFDDALARDQYTYDLREQNFGYSDPQTLSSKFGIARDLRRLGRYEEALDLSRELATSWKSAVSRGGSFACPSTPT